VPQHLEKVNYLKLSGSDVVLFIRCRSLSRRRSFRWCRSIGFLRCVPSSVVKISAFFICYSLISAAARFPASVQAVVPSTFWVTHHRCSTRFDGCSRIYRHRVISVLVAWDITTTSRMPCLIGSTRRRYAHLSLRQHALTLPLYSPLSPVLFRLRSLPTHLRAASWRCGTSRCGYGSGMLCGFRCIFADQDGKTRQRSLRGYLCAWIVLPHKTERFGADAVELCCVGRSAAWLTSQIYRLR